MSNAFASIMQARPCPTFGRPVHLEVALIDYGPVLLLMPFGFHFAVDTLPSRELQAAASGPPWTVSGFRFRARLGFSIPSPFSGPRGITPAFGYSAPHLSAEGTLTPMSNMLLSTHYGTVRPWLAHRYFRPRGSAACAFSLTIACQVLKFHTKARIRVTPPVHRTSRDR